MRKEPAESVDVLSGDLRDTELPKLRARNLFRAALVVAVIAWITTFFVAVHSSETNGIYASWFAIFPTGFMLGGFITLELDGRAGVAVRNAFLAGAAGSAGLWFFFQAIWPSL